MGVPEVPVVDAEAHQRYCLLLENHLRDFYGRTLGRPPDSVDTAIRLRLSRVRGETFAKLVDDYVGLAGRHLLDVGSGWGELVLSCLTLGANARGIEPNAELVKISRLLLTSHGYSEVVDVGTGEDLPFADGSFDIVTCQQVLEHVQDLHRTISELVRVTRTGGFIVVSVPNYLFPYEGHYMMKWFPLTPKPIGKLVLRAAGRDPDFLVNHVNYTTYPMMMRLWKKHNLVIRDLTRERLVAGQHKHQLYRHRLLRQLAIRLSLFPNLTWLLEKVDSAGR
jgi:2-polyprenyl-3-methyl-5-hydroxy-6-metoxy-1,4-benzoquinol methylase